MHYYERNIGDYYRKAGRLNILQHGVYTLLIDACYDREQFPTLDEAIDWVWAETDEEVEAVKFVLCKFFKLNESGVYVQNHIEEDLIAYKNFLTKQSENGKKGGRPPKNKPKDNLGNGGIDLDGIGINESTQINPTETQINPNKPNESLNHLTNNQEPLTNDLYTNTGEQKNSLDDDLNLWNPSLDEINTWRKRAGLLETTQEEFNHTMVTFMPHYAPQIRIGTLKQNQVFSKYIAWVKRDYKPLTSTPKAKPQPQTNNRNVNQAWGDIPEHAPADPDVAARLAASLAEEDYL